MEAKKYICNICNKKYKSPQSLSNHKKLYHTQNDINLTITNPILTITNPIIDHKMVNKEPLKDNTICEYCNKKLSAYTHLRRHLKTCKIKQKNLDDYDKILKENEEIKKENEEIKKNQDEIKKAFDELKTMMMEMMNNKCKMHPKKFNKLINSNNNNSNNLTINNNRFLEKLYRLFL